MRAWLEQIARNAALGQLRRTRGHESLDDVLKLPDEAPAPDESAASEEEAELVRGSLARLPENLSPAAGAVSSGRPIRSRRG